MTQNTLQNLVVVVTLALDSGMNVNDIADATRHGTAGELALYLCRNSETELANRLLAGLKADFTCE